jgi:hypothetical protein
MFLKILNKCFQECWTDAFENVEKIDSKILKKFTNEVALQVYTRPFFNG